MIYLKEDLIEIYLGDDLIEIYLGDDLIEIFKMIIRISVVEIFSIFLLELEKA